MSNIEYEGKVNIRLSVDVSQPNMFAPPLVKQGDSNTRALVITLTDDSEPIAIPDVATVWLNCRNTADNEKRASVECEINADGTVTGIVPTVVMEAAGIIECDVSVITLSESNETELLKSTLFCLLCERAANKDGTTTEAEDSILAGIASGEITIPAAKGDPGPPGPPGPAGSSVTIINSETVPESAEWDGEIPTTYAGQTGEKGEIAFWNGELWYLYNVATLGQTTYYHWDKVAVTEDLEGKMDLAPLNPTAEQIAAMAGGQIYGDKITQDEYDEALGVKLPQDFYYQGVLKFFSAYASDNRYPRVYRSRMRPLVESIAFSPKVGSFWLYYTNDDTVQSLYVLSYNGGSGSSQYWRKLNNHIDVVNTLPISDPMPYKTNYPYDISGYEIPLYDVNDEIIVSANGQVALYKCLGYNKVYDSSLGGYKAVYNWQEKSRIYTKTEIDSMLGDIESLLSEV